MKIKYCLGFFLLFLCLSIAQERSDVVLLSSINLGIESINFFELIEDILIFAKKDELIFYDIKGNKELNRIKVRSKEVLPTENVFITNFEILNSQKIAVVNNEPYLIIYDLSKKSETSFKYNKKNTYTEINNFPLTQVKKIEDLIISPLGNFLMEKVHIFNYLIGEFFQIDEWIEYNITSISKGEVLYKISTKKDLKEFEPCFSNKDKYLFLLNPILKTGKSYALIIKDINTGKDLKYFGEDDRLIGWFLSPDDKYLVISLGEREETKLIDLSSLREIKSFSFLGNPFLSPSGKLLAIEGNSRITVFSLENDLVLFNVMGSHPVFSFDENLLAYSLGEHFLAPTKEIDIYSWKKELIRKIPLDKEYFLEKMEFTKDGKYLILLLMGGDGYKISIFQIKGG